MVGAGTTTSPNFYPRSPCGERQTSLVVIGTNCVISIHALLAESDRADRPRACYCGNFYPRSPCGERPAGPAVHHPGNAISIHALLAESDPLKAAITAAPQQISIHALLAESDQNIRSPRACARNFYPRSPCGERLGFCACCTKYFDFYPRSPCGERQTLHRGQKS